jgi:hypothetical protein
MDAKPMVTAVVTPKSNNTKTPAKMANMTMVGGSPDSWLRYEGLLSGFNRG